MYVDDPILVPLRIGQVFVVEFRDVQLIRLEDVVLCVLMFCDASLDLVRETKRRGISLRNWRGRSASGGVGWKAVCS